MRNLTYSMSRSPNSGTTTTPVAPPASLIDWNLYEAQETTAEFDIYDPQESVRAIAAELYARLDDPPASDDEDNVEWSDTDIEADELREPMGDCKHIIDQQLR